MIEKRKCVMKVSSENVTLTLNGNMDAVRYINA